MVSLEKGWVHGPQLLPDRRGILFTRLLDRNSRSWEGAELVVHDLVSGQQQVLIPGEDGRYLPSGHLLYAADTTLFAARFDAASRRIVGRAVPVVEGVRREVAVGGNTATANYGFTDDGTLMYIAGPRERFPVVTRDLVMVDLQGTVLPITDERRDYWRPRFSPDGSRVVVEVFENSGNLRVVSLATRASTQTTFSGGANFPVWTRDGRSLVYSLFGSLHRKPADGSSEAEPLGISGNAVPTDVSRDNILAFSLGEQTAARAIWTMSLHDRRAVEILATPAQEHMPMFSPDGRWLAYASNASGQQEVYVRPYPIMPGTERRISEGGGAGPVWAPDGRTLYYRGADDRALMAAAMPAAPDFMPGRPRVLFAADKFRFSGNAPAFDIHPDGDRFVMVTRGDAPPPERNQINVVLDWFGELERRLPR
jgi:serine/threonine-protein kinase